MIKAQKPLNPPKILDNFGNKNNKYLSSLKGTEIIKYKAKNLPAKPGVYQMENKNGKILYIGKAKNLSKRVISYSNPNNLTVRLQRMVFQTKNINYTVTNSEIDALLLECNLIKRFKPKFNIILRDDKSFPFILINKEHKFPRIQKYRGPRKIKGDYYGPFVSPSLADSTILSIQKTFNLRTCTDSYFSNRSRPCLLYDIKRCSAPCKNKISEKNYKDSINDAKKYLSGNSKSIEKKLTKLMNISSKKMEYENAGRLRDRIKSLKQNQKYQSVYIKDFRNIDVFAIKIVNGKSCIFGMFFRNGSNYGNKAFFPVHDSSSSEYEILESFLFQFYSDKEPPPKILINLKEQYFDNIKLIFNKKYKIKINILNPKKGEKEKHIKLAEKNAEENIKTKNNSIENHKRSLMGFKKLLKMKDLPKRIEVYDNSHIFGKQPIGVMIVINQEGFDNKSYRKFNIKFNNLESKSESNDYYMLEEVLNRRLARIDEENWNLPEVIIIDGGKGHLNIAKKILRQKKIKNIEIISVAKGVKRNAGREIIYYKEKSKSIKSSDSTLHFIQRIRDEAHRFAIYSHRKKRSKELVKSIFNEMQGIGPKRKRVLIKFFGSVENISNASIKELYKVDGISKNIAKYIYEFFNSH